MEANGTLTLMEAAQITGKSQTTIYKYIQRGAISCKKSVRNGKEVLTVQKTDIERLFNISCPTEQHTEKQCETDFSSDNNQVINIEPEEQETLTAEKVREVIEDFFSTRQAELVKPLEQNAIYRLGRFEQENLFLKQRLETLLIENNELQKKLKCLPGPAESIIQILLDNASNMQFLQSEKFKLESEIKDLQQGYREEIERLKQQAEEKRKLSETCQKKVEELSKPWWKLW